MGQLVRPQCLVTVGRVSEIFLPWDLMAVDDEGDAEEDDDDDGAWAPRET